jgi:HEPN domain-containing protein
LITLEELQNLSRDRLEDAKVLYMAGRKDWAVYTCGYAVELALKKKICEALRWNGFPSSDKEFEGLKSFKTHSLEMLLHLSGVESQIKEEALMEWSIVASWGPEKRYSSQKQTEQSAKLLLESVETLLKKI